MLKGIADLPKDVLLTARIIAYLIAIGLAWWASDTVIDWIRGPVQAKLDIAVGANKRLVETNENLVVANRKLSETLKARGEREVAIDQRLDSLQRGLREKKTDPEVKQWAETKIPAKVLQ